MSMPFYEYQCSKCGSRTEVFARRMDVSLPPPSCPATAGDPDGAHEMQRVVSRFQRRLTEADKIAEAEAKYGKEVDAALGATPDVGKLSRRYENLAGGLPRREDA
jgi:putative FmdB family regulatory protein